jgi:hypothetical protein
MLRILIQVSVTLNEDFLDLFIFEFTVKKKLFSDVGVHKQVLINIRVS